MICDRFNCLPSEARRESAAVLQLLNYERLLRDVGGGGG